MGFKAYVEDIIGNVPTGLNINIALREGVEDVISRIKRYFPEDIYNYAQKLLLDVDGHDILDFGDPTHVYRRNIECVRINPTMRHKAENFSSIHYRTHEDPAYYIDAGILRTIPSAQGSIKTFATTSSGGTGLTKIQTDNHGLKDDDTVVVTGTTDYNGTYQETVKVVDEDNFTIPVSYVSSQSGSWDQRMSYALLFKLGDNADNLENVTTGNVDNFPRGKERGIILFAARKVALAQMAEIIDEINNELRVSFPNELVTPQTVSPPNLATVFDNLEDVDTFDINPFVPPPPVSMPDPPDSITIDVSGYFAITFDVDLTDYLADVSGELSVITGDEIDISTLLPDVQDYDFDEGDLDSTVLDVSGLMATISYPNLEGIEPPELTPLPHPEPPSFTNSDSEISTLQAPTYIPPVIAPPNYDKINEYIQTAEDVELAQSQLSEVQTKLSEYQTQVQIQGQSFQSEVEEYKALIQEKMTDLEHGHKVEMAEYTSKLSKYQADVGKNIQEFNAELTKYSERVKTEFENRKQINTAELESKRQNVTAEVESKKHNLQVKLEEAKHNLMATLEESKTSIQARLDEHRQKVQTDQVIIENKKQRIAGLIEEAKHNVSLKLEEAKQNTTAKIETARQNATAEIESKTQQSNQDIARYTAEVNAKIQEAKNTTEINLGASDASIKEMTAHIQYISEANKIIIEQVSAEIKVFEAETQSNTALYNIDVQKHAMELQKITAKYDNFIKYYQQKQSQINEIQKEYDEMFHILPQGIQTPNQQQGERK